MSLLEQSIEIRGGAVQEVDGYRQLRLPLPVGEGVHVCVRVKGEGETAVLHALVQAEKVIEATHAIEE